MQNLQRTVLVADDNRTNIDVLVGALSEDYEIVVAMNGQSALELTLQCHPDLILLDVMMPGMDGFEVCRRLKVNNNTSNIPVIFLTGMAEIKDKSLGFSLGAVDYITKPFDTSEVKTRVKTHLYISIAKQQLERQNEILEEKVKERTKELVLTRETTIECLASLAEYRDPETGGHISRTKSYVVYLAKQIEHHHKFRDYLNKGTIELLSLSAPLHDIGKVGIPDQILLKPGKLTIEEFEIMKKHSVIGRDALQKAEKKLGYNSFLCIASEIAYTHHEKWDGTGYPCRLKAEEIPVCGRLMAIADVYDALISKRTYKQPFTHVKAVEIIIEGKGKHFDPEMVDAFLEIQDTFRQIALSFADYDEERDALAVSS